MNRVNPYQNNGQYVLGFHGCSEEIATTILNSTTDHLKPSKNEYDWLGSGIYFWLNDPIRAKEWAEETHKRSPNRLKQPFVLGAVIDLGYCLNLNERIGVQLLKKSYEDLKTQLEILGIGIHDIHNERPDDGGFFIKRPLDCLVINHLHDMLKKENIHFDTVFAYFQEGNDAFEGAGIKEKSHVQICVLNKECIKGYFLPREKDE